MIKKLQSDLIKTNLNNAAESTADARRWLVEAGLLLAETDDAALTRLQIADVLCNLRTVAAQIDELSPLAIARSKM